MFSLFRTEYQVGAALARKAVEVRYDPENLAEIGVWHDGRMAEPVTPFVVTRHRRQHVEMPFPPPAPATPTGDGLGHLTDERRMKNFVESTPQMLAEAAAQPRAEADVAVFDVLAARLAAAVVDAPTIRAFLAPFGPWGADRVAVFLDRLLLDHPRDFHVQVYLELLHPLLEAVKP